MLLLAATHLKFVLLKTQPPAPGIPGWTGGDCLFFMKRIFLFFCACSCFFAVQAQTKTPKKYPSLLWEITGPGMKKPSYLIGTMHVSSKIAFNLPDSFYIALRNAQVVALESNPETWQEDMSKYDLGESGNYNDASKYSSYLAGPNEYLNIKTLKFFRYSTKIQRSLYSNPATINNLLYRTYGNDASDFEEDTYLDMYIFQCGKKWGKKITGVEDYGESMKLMAEAYKDAAKDKNRKTSLYGDIDDAYSADKLQEAYRMGNLDLLDSINKYNSVSDAFDEKFLYRRNEIQAFSIDSILRSGSSLFVGVGAAHLPGERGVIEILRKRGYKLRPVKMGERASREKDQVDKIRVPVVFKTEIAEDGSYKVDIPGKFYKVGEDPALDQRQYADMSNGSYYMVTRVMTNAWMWNHSTDDVYRTIDSLLYENVPGKIVAKNAITKNGYRGFDITSRTRRGDLQRYNILVTPFEILFFKMSGNADYVKNGPEAERFFGSIQLREYKSAPDQPVTNWKKFMPEQGGFSIDLPHDPYRGNDGSWIYDATDRSTGTHYRLIRTDIHNYHFVEEDTFDLGLMEESFGSSDFIAEQVSRKQTNYKGYPALDCKFRDIDGSIYLTRFLIQGPHYYTLIAHGKKETSAMVNFLNSFSIQPLVYGEAKQQKDTSLYYTVTTPVFPDDKKIKFDIPRYSFSPGEDEEESEDDMLERGAYRSKTISNDTTGEKIFVTFYRLPRYYYSSDSAALEEDNNYSLGDDKDDWIVRLKKKAVLPGNIKTLETIVSDTNSSRAIWTRSFYKDGIGFSLTTQTDTLSQPSAFLRQFYDSFTPVDTLKGINPLEKKSPIFFADLASPDSSLRKRAVKHITEIELDSSDLLPLTKAIARINWNEKKYLDTKTALINKLGDIKTVASDEFLRSLYYSLDDTVQLQYSVLENLLQHKTANAYRIFGDIIATEPPVLNTGPDEDGYSISPLIPYISIYNLDNGRFLDELSDSLRLAKTILPQLLPLLNLDDYEIPVMKLMGQMVDSQLLSPADYDLYISKFLIEAKQALKKQSIAEKKKAIEKAEEDKEEMKTPYYYYKYDKVDKGNDQLSMYATLLIPCWDQNAAVPGLIRQMLNSADKRVKYNTLLALLKQKRSYPDTLLNYFANMDEFRYELYSDLKLLKQLDKFPKLYNNHLDLGRSWLLTENEYDDPDTLVYLDRLKAEYVGQKGFMYFYKYKTRKEDMGWKLAVAGLIPEDPGQFQFADSSKQNPLTRLVSIYDIKYDPYSFTDLSDTKLIEGEAVQPQLKKMLRKILYATRKSAKLFYKEEADKGAMPYYYD